MYPQSGPGPGAPGPAVAEPQSVAAFLFGVIARRRTWLNFAYLWLAFPLGLSYLVFLVTGLSVGIGLSITLVGIPILLLVVVAWWALAAFERASARALLGADVGPTPRPWRSAEGLWARMRAVLGAGSTWRDLAFLLLKFPMGIASFVLCVTGLAIVVSFIGAPILQQFGALTIGGARVDSWLLAALLVPVGILALLVWLHVLNGFAWLSARLAEALLGRGERGSEVGAEAGPVMAPMAPYGPRQESWPTQTQQQGAPLAWGQAPPQGWAYAPPQVWVYPAPQTPPSPQAPQTPPQTPQARTPQAPQAQPPADAMSPETSPETAGEQPAEP